MAYAREYELEADCAEVWELAGYEVVKLSQPRWSLTSRGIPDAYVRHRGLRDRLWVEYKLPGKEPTDEQQAWHSRERAAGGDVLVVHDPDDVVAYLRRQGVNLDWA